MDDRVKIECDKCNNTYELIHDGLDEPVFCPFCGDYADSEDSVYDDEIDYDDDD